MNFKFSLLGEERKIIQFKTGENKIPALNFTIQITNQKMLKVKRPVYTPKNNKHVTEINEIKTAIKKMFLTNQKNKKV